MALAFGDHPDVVFGRAPLETVLCQVRFPPIFALVDSTAIAGLQAAIRDAYPDGGDPEIEAAVAINPTAAAIQQGGPVWRFWNAERTWRASIGVDFLALDTSDSAGYHWTEFRRRLDVLLAAVDLTVHPGMSRRIGVRKVNVFHHPDVEVPRDWQPFLRDELLGLAASPVMPAELAADYAEVHVPDGDGGTLSIRHGVDPADLRRYRVDLDYWTDARSAVSASSGIGDRLAAYAGSMTGFFHWCLKTPLFDYLEPRPRGAAS